MATVKEKIYAARLGYAEGYRNEPIMMRQEFSEQGEWRDIAQFPEDAYKAYLAGYESGQSDSQQETGNE